MSALRRAGAIGQVAPTRLFGWRLRAGWPHRVELSSRPFARERELRQESDFTRVGFRLRWRRKKCCGSASKSAASLAPGVRASREWPSRKLDPVFLLAIVPARVSRMVFPPFLGLFRPDCPCEAWLFRFCAAFFDLCIDSLLAGSTWQKGHGQKRRSKNNEQSTQIIA